MEQYIYWAVTGGISLLGGTLIYLIKRGLERNDRRIDAQEKHVQEVEDKLNKTISDMPFLYTLREDFIRSTANHDRKLDQIIELLTRGGNQHG